MNKELVIQEVAKLDGWFLHKRNSLIMYKTGDNKPDGCVTEESHIEAQKLSRYLTSRDAIIPVIEKQITNPEIEMKFNYALYAILPRRHIQHGMTYVMAILATPAQLCQALLTTIGKWES